MGSSYLFTLQQALKVGVFYWFHVENSNHLHTEISLGYLKDRKFYRKSKAFFTHISSIASCRFRMSGGENIALFTSRYHAYD